MLNPPHDHQANKTRQRLILCRNHASGIRLEIEPWGDSLAVRLPPALLQQLGVAAGDVFEVIDLCPERMTLRTVKLIPQGWQR